MSFRRRVGVRECVLKRERGREREHVVIFEQLMTAAAAAVRCFTAKRTNQDSVCLRPKQGPKAGECILTASLCPAAASH